MRGTAQLKGEFKKNKLCQKITRKVRLNVNKQDTSITLYNGCDEETADTLVSTLYFFPISYFHWFALGNKNKWLANKWFKQVIACLEKTNKRQQGK